MAVDRVVVVGASAAGLTAVETLRREGFPGKVTLIGDEPHHPYDRPPLSKQILTGEWEQDQLHLRQPHLYEDLQLDLRLNTSAVGLDPDSRLVHLADGSQERFDGLILATGARARTLPVGQDLDGVLTLRTLSDALEIKSRLTTVSSVAVIGAGFLGLEVGAVARSMGKKVTVIDSMGLPMLRPFGAVLATVVRDLHVAHGVDLHLARAVDTVEVDEAGRVAGVRLTDGLVCPAELVVVAVGAVCNDAWCSELAGGNGVICDEYCATAPGIYAAGDVASWTNPLFGERMRVENKLNATEQGRAAAENLLGRQAAYAPVPYYWTDQYDVKLQAYGIFPSDARFEVVAGSLEEMKFVAYYLRDGHVVGAVGSCMAGLLRRSREAISNRLSLDESVATAGAR